MARSTTSFKSGNSGNRRGRPPGKTEGAKRLTLEKVADFLAKDFEDDSKTGFLKDWQEVGATGRMKVRTNLYEYILKKLSRSEMIIDVSRLTDHQVDELLDTIQERFDGDDDTE
jgi:hypothetical protein